jgi:hypothetical protein
LSGYHADRESGFAPTARTLAFPASSFEKLRGLRDLPKSAIGPIGDAWMPAFCRLSTCQRASLMFPPNSRTRTSLLPSLRWRAAARAFGFGNRKMQCPSGRAGRGRMARGGDRVESAEQPRAKRFARANQDYWYRTRPPPSGDLCPCLIERAREEGFSISAQRLERSGQPYADPNWRRGGGGCGAVQAPNSTVGVVRKRPPRHRSQS